MVGKLENMVCIVRGASRGMGRETAREMARQVGKIVVATYLIDGGDLAWRGLNS